MNILYHHRTQGKGVEAIHIRSIVNALEELGHNVMIISPTGCDPMQEKILNSENDSKSIKVIFSFISRNCPEVIFEGLEIIYNILAYVKIKRKIKKKKISLIYERYFLFSIASMLLANKYKIPVIYEVNDSSFLPRLRHLKASKIANYLERKILSKADAVITVSSYFKNQLVNVGLPAVKILVSQNAVDSTKFNSESIKDVSVKIPPGCLVLGFVGLFVKWVGLERFVYIFRKIQAQYSNTHLLLIGSGPEEKNLKRKTREFNLEFHITFAGSVSHDEVPSYISLMDICVIPKHERYTSPVKLFEYMAMGKAILVPAYESIKEVIRHRENGMLFIPDDEESFIANLKELIDNRELLLSIGKNAKKRSFKKVYLAK